MFKHIRNNIRKLLYGSISQQIICVLLWLYLFFVYLTSKKTFVNMQIFIELVKQKQPIIVAFWHNRLAMIPFFARKAGKQLKNHRFMTLASRHGDGKFVSLIMQKFGFITISGSSRQNRKLSRGIDFANMRAIINGLNQGYTLGITPDGPRGPAKKINGELLNIAKATQAKILCISYSAKNNLIFNSWDRLKVPLPFNNIKFYVHNQIITVDSNASKAEIAELTTLTTTNLNIAQQQSQQL